MPAAARPDLLKRLRELEVGRSLLERLGDQPGVHLVGGAVRDLLLECRPRELDLVVEGDPAPVAARIGGGARHHERFNTVTVELAGHRIDLARARRETYPLPGALPEVEPAPLAEDLSRRDFTINAMALTLGGDQAGALNAVAGAMSDLDARLLRVLHERSFEEDPTRLLRMTRYRARLELVVEAHTEQRARHAISSGALKTVSGTRIGAELRLLAREEDPVRALRDLEADGLAAAIDPALGLADESSAGIALTLLDGYGRRDLLALALALQGVPSRRLKPLLDRLGFRADEREVIVHVATGSAALAGALRGSPRPSEIAEVFRGCPPEAVALAGALGPAEAASEWLARLRHVTLQINGEDLLAAGVPPGPAVGASLRAALAATLDGRADDRATQLAQALRSISEER